MWEELKKEALGEKYQMYLVVKDAIDEWNPYGLLPEAPSNEFDSESERIAIAINKGYSVKQIAKVISIVFTEMFEPFTEDVCMKPASKIKDSLENL